MSDGICPCENKQVQNLKRKQELEALKQANKVAVEHNFEAVAREWYKDTKPEWKNQKDILAVMSRLEMYVFPLIGSKHVAEVTKADIGQ